MKLATIALLAYGAAATAAAQNPAPVVTKTPLPGGALLGRTPAYGCWEITRRNGMPEDSAAPAALNEHVKPGAKQDKAKKPNRESGKTPLPATVSLATKTWDILHIETTDPQGRKSQEWHKKEFQILTRPEWHEPLLSVAGDVHDASYNDYSKSDFPTLRWIAKSNYTGVETMDGHVCMVFRDVLYVNRDGSELSTKGPLPSPAPDATVLEAAQPVVAYIDYYSRFPVRVSRGGQTDTYQFPTPPDGMLVLPDEFQALINAQQEQIKQRTAAPSQP